MLIVFCGNDTIGVRQQAHTRIAAFADQEHHPIYIDAENYEPGMLADAAGATSLFGERSVYIIDTPSGDPAMYDDVIDQLAVLQESSNPFVVIEGPLTAPEKKKFAKYAEALEESKGAPRERFNVFQMGDALVKKDKRTLWILLQEARMAGLSNEEIIGTLWWQLKTLRLAAHARSAVDAGMKDFPFNKAKRALRHFTPGEAERRSHELLAVYHDGHLGKTELDLALEAWTLRL